MFLVFLQLGDGLLRGLQALLCIGQLVTKPGVFLTEPAHLGPQLLLFCL